MTDICSTEAPERAHVLVMTISADTVEDLAYELEQCAYRVLTGQLTTGVSGGYASGAIYSYKVRPEQTHDVYFTHVQRWLAERHAAGACAVQEAASS